MKLNYLNRTGLLPEHVNRILILPTYLSVRLTIPAYEILSKSGARIEQYTSVDGTFLYDVTLQTHQTVPTGLVVSRSRHTSNIGIRMAIEPDFPGEIKTYFEQLDFTPCPKCGSPLIWYEAGYVPGYRVCVKKPHHHAMPHRE